MQHFMEVSDVLSYISCFLSFSPLWECSVTKDSLALSYVQCTTCFRQVIFILWGLDNTSGCVVEGLEVLTLTWKLL